MADTPTIGSSFDPRRNSLNALRLGLAVLVIVSHSWPVGGYGSDPGFGGASHQDLGDLAVAGFFAISGFLITGSRLTSRNLRDYLWRRFLRIYPAFVTCLLVVAFVFAPLATAFFGGGQYQPLGAAKYVVANLALTMRQLGVPDTLRDVPLPGLWDGALWSLFYEFLCYLGIGFAVSWLARRRLPLALVLAYTGCLAVTLGFSTVSFPLALMARLGGFFIAGALIYLYRDRIPMRGALGVGAVALTAATLATGTFSAFGGPPFAYLMLYLGARLPLHKVGARNDVSYGVYIYGFPVQQTLALAFRHHHLPVAVFVLLAVALTVPLAVASWFVVEKPMMRLKRLTAGRGVALHELSRS